MTLYQHAKNQATSRCMFDLKIQQSDWPRAFWSISQEQDLSQIWDLCRDTANNINFHCIQNLEKTNNPLPRKRLDGRTGPSADPIF